jgi:hypothetical protein
LKTGKRVKFILKNTRDCISDVKKKIARARSDLFTVIVSNIYEQCIEKNLKLERRQKNYSILLRTTRASERPP